MIQQLTFSALLISIVFILIMFIPVVYWARKTERELKNKMNDFPKAIREKIK